MKTADGTTTCSGCDQDLLAQRKALLRPDSLVAIVMVPDENDCSIRDDGPGWLVASSIATQGQMWRATSVCHSNPNDKCCRSCGLYESVPPDGCSALKDDPVCRANPVWDLIGDKSNLRCFDRIVGVLWQDLADDASLHGPGLNYLTLEELVTKGRWSVLIGDPQASPVGPGTRELEVLKGLSDQGIAASICPKVTTASIESDSDPSYGYNPAVAAIIERLKSALSGECLPRAPETDPVTQEVLCHVVEAQPTGCHCGAPGRADVDPLILPAVLRQLQAAGHCGSPGLPSCTSFCACEIQQETAAADVAACRSGQAPATGAKPGYCYVDDPTSPLLKKCVDTKKRKLQFVSTADEPTPTPGAATFVACLGAPLSTAVSRTGNRTRLRSVGSGEV